MNKGQLTAAIDAGLKGFEDFNKDVYPQGEWALSYRPVAKSVSRTVGRPSLSEAEKVANAIKRAQDAPNAFSITGDKDPQTYYFKTREEAIGAFRALTKDCMDAFWLTRLSDNVIVKKYEGPAYRWRQEERS